MVPTLTMGLRMICFFTSLRVGGPRGVLAVFVPARPENVESLATRRSARLPGCNVRARVYRAARTGLQAFDDDDDEQIMKAFF